jgi:hypothetical protein
LLEAQAILQPFQRATTTDPEMLEIWGAIHRRLSELPDASETARLAALDTAILALSGLSVSATTTAAASTWLFC